MKRIFLGLATLLMSFGIAVAGPNGYNGFGSVTRPANTTAYLANTLFAANTTGNASAAQIAVQGTTPSDNYIVGARLYTTDTAASGAAFAVYLFSNPPTTTGLIDGSSYKGPYAADLKSYLGTLTCGSMKATNDATSQYYAECSISNLVTTSIRFSGAAGTTTIYAMVAVTTGYTPISGSAVTVALATLK